MKRSTVTLSILGAAAIGVSSFALMRPEPAPVGSNAALTPTLSAAATARDPEGNFGRPSAAQAKRLERELARTLARHAPSAAATVERFRADGAISKVLPLEHLSFSVARIGADGVIERDCTRGLGATADFLLTLPASPATTPEEM